MSSITVNQVKANRARAEDLANRLSDALRDLTKAEGSVVLIELIERVCRDDATRPKATHDH